MSPHSHLAAQSRCAFASYTGSTLPQNLKIAQFSRSENSTDVLSYEASSYTLNRFTIRSPGDAETNREYVGEDVSIANDIDPNLVKLVYDPQTAGGLLLAIPQEKANDLLTELRKNYPSAEVIGRAKARADKIIFIN